MAATLPHHFTASVSKASRKPNTSPHCTGAVSQAQACIGPQLSAADKAVTYLSCFAEKAARSYAHAEALTALQEALTHVERLPGGR